MRRVLAILVLLAATARADPASKVVLAEAKVLLPGSETCDAVACVIDHAYRAEPKARQLARTLWTAHGSVAGLGAEEVMDGGYRGKIHLVPELPTGRHRAHLGWVVDAMTSIDQLFAALFADQPAPRYRWQGVAFRFVRSLGKRTPSAYATSWTITYNVAGSLLTSSAGVQETLVHELFHLNDEAHDGWSSRYLQADYDGIVTRCRGAQTRCLAPYAPNSTMVRGGTYYAFQPNNGAGVHEYAAELAVRYLREQREMLERGKLTRRAFKCGPPANGRAWQAMVDEFFAGRDLVPAC